MRARHLLPRRLQPQARRLVRDVLRPHSDLPHPRLLGASLLDGILLHLPQLRRQGLRQRHQWRQLLQEPQGMRCPRLLRGKGREDGCRLPGPQEQAVQRHRLRQPHPRRGQ